MHSSVPVFLAAGLRYPQGRSVKDRPCFFCLVLKKFTDVEHDAQRVIGYVLAF